MKSPWETNNSSSNHKIHSILCNTKTKVFSQISTTCPYPGPDKSISWHSTYSFNINFNNTLPSILMFLKRSLFFGLAKSNPCMYFSSSLDTPHALSTSSPFVLITRIICSESWWKRKWISPCTWRLASNSCLERTLAVLLTQASGETTVLCSNPNDYTGIKTIDFSCQKQELCGWRTIVTACNFHKCKSSLCIMQPPVTSPLPRHVLSPCLSLNIRKK